MHTRSLGTVPLDGLAAAVRAVQERFRLEPDREEVLERRFPARSCSHLGKNVRLALTLGTVTLDSLAAAVHAVPDRLQHEPARELTLGKT